jgi:hypothetical protein
MRDMVDGFVRQNIKNWAARQQPSASGKARLLLLASSRHRINASDENPEALSIPNKRNNYITPLVNSPSPCEQIVEPISQTRLWLLQISPSFSLLRNVA